MLGVLLLTSALALPPEPSTQALPVDEIYPTDQMASVTDQTIDQIVSELDLETGKQSHEDVVIAGETLNEQELSIVEHFATRANSDLSDVVNELNDHARLASYSKQQVVFELGVQLLEQETRLEEGKNFEIGKAKNLSYRDVTKVISITPMPV